MAKKGGGGAEEGLVFRGEMGGEVGGVKRGKGYKKRKAGRMM